MITNDKVSKMMTRGEREVSLDVGIKIIFGKIDEAIIYGCPYN